MKVKKTDNEIIIVLDENEENLPVLVGKHKDGVMDLYKTDQHQTDWGVIGPSARAKLAEGTTEV